MTLKNKNFCTKNFKDSANNLGGNFLFFVGVVLVTFFIFQSRDVFAAINSKINYQGKLTDLSNVAVNDGAYDIVFKFYTVAGGGSAIWTESWTDANLFTDDGTDMTVDGCSSGVDKVAYTDATNESSLAAGQLLWNTDKKNSAVIESVSAAGNYVCVYSAPSDWVDGDEVTNRIYVKNGLFSVMLGGVSSLDSVNFNQAVYLGVKVGGDSEMVPRKTIGAVPGAFEARQLEGATWEVPGSIGITTPNAGAFTTLSSIFNGSSTAFTVNQSGAGWLADFQKSGASKLMIDNSGNVGIGMTSPTAVLHLKAGTATVSTAPLKFTSGTSLAIPEAGAMEFDGTNLYFTDSTPTRQTLITNSSLTSTLGSYLLASGAIAGATSQAQTFTNGVNLSNLAQGYLPYASNSSKLLANSGIYYDGNNVGIGTTVPESKLDLTVAPGNSSFRILRSDVSSTDGYFMITNYTGAANIFAPIFTGKSNNSSYPGMAFIGDVSSDSGSAPIVRFQARQNATTVSTRPLFTFENYTDVKMLVNSAGNVGIGTTVPLTTLHVVGISTFQSGSATGGISIGADVNATTRSSNVRKLGRISIPSYNNGYNISVLSADSYDAYSDYLYFGGMPGSTIVGPTSISFGIAATKGDSSSNTNIMRVTSAGLGIGTTLPAAKLEVLGPDDTTGLALDLKNNSGTSKFKVNDYGAVTSNYFNASGSGFSVSTNSGSLGVSSVNDSGTAFTTNVLTTHTADLADFQKDGVSLVKILNSGNVGIGTTAPTEKLTVNGNIYLSANTGTDYIDSAGSYTLKRGGTNRIGLWSGATTIYDSYGDGVLTASNGNIGIGEQSPTAKLVLKGSGSSSSSYAFYVKNNDDTNLFAVRNDGNIGVGTSSPGAKLNSLSTTEQLRLSYDASNYASFTTDSSGNLTIGGTTKRLYLGAGEANTNIVQTLQNTADTYTRMGIVWRNTSITVPDFTGTWGATMLDTHTMGMMDGVSSSYGGIQFAGFTSTTQDATALYFTGVNGATSPTAPSVIFRAGKHNGSTGATSLASSEKAFAFNNWSSTLMTILGGGNVGIGTTAPSHKLQIVDTDTTASRAGLYIAQSGAISGTGYGSYITKTGGSTTNVGGYFSASGATNNYGLIVAAGNVGIGTTAPAGTFELAANAAGKPEIILDSQDNSYGYIHSKTDSQRLLFAGGSAASSSHGGYFQVLGNDWSGSAGFRGRVVFAAGIPSSLTGLEGSIAFFTNTAERMDILNNGNVGIGTTSPTAVLHLKAGTATVSTAPLKFTSGTSLAIPEAGAMEFDGTNLYFTPSSSRKTIAFTDSTLSGTWNGSVISPAYGGTGAANNVANTITFSGNYALGLTLSGTTSLTLPATGTLATLAGSESLTNKKLGSLTTDGFVKTSGSDGTLTVDTSTYLTSLSGALLADGTVTGATSQAQAFTNGVKTGLIYPNSDSTTALQFNKADGTTNVMDIDTTNGYVGIGTTSPMVPLEIFSTAGSNPTFRLSDADVALPNYSSLFTSYTNMIAFWGGYSGTNGGYQLSGFTKSGTNDGTPVALIGYHGGIAPTTAAINLIGYKWDGSTSRAALGGAEIVLQVSNGIGNPKFTVLGNGNIGIGKANPAYSLDVAGSINISSAWLSLSDNYGIGWNDLSKVILYGSGSGDYFGIKTNGTDRFRISSAGKIGIGTTNPSSILHLNGTLGSLAGGLAFGDGDTGLYELSDDNFRLQTAGSDRITVDSSGNVGIGTTGPLDKLSIVGGGSAEVGVLAGAGAHLSVYNNGAAYYAGRDTANDIEFGFGTSIALEVFAGAMTNHKFSLRTNNIDRVTIDTSGNVGIGTTSPVTTLNVVGTDIILDRYVGSAVGPYIIGRHSRGTASSPSAVSVDDSLVQFGGRGYGATAFSSNNVGYMQIMAAEDFTDSAQGTYIKFATTPTGSVTAAERLRIDSSGNLGIGTTAPTAKLHLEDAQTDPSTGTYSTYLRAYPTYTGSESVTESFYNIDAQLKPIVNAGHTNSGNMIGQYVGSMRNWNSASSDDGGTLTNLYGSQILFGNYNTNTSAMPTITNAYGLYIYPFYRTGVISNMYDLYISAPSTGGVIGNHWAIYNASSADNYIAGSVGIGTTAPAYDLDVGGGTSGYDIRGYNVYTHDGGVHSFSDVRLKDISGSYTRGLAEVMQLNPIYYHYKNDNPLRLDSSAQNISLAAQEVQKLIPEAVEIGQDGYLTLNSSPLFYTLVNAVKEQQKEIESLGLKLNDTGGFSATSTFDIALAQNDNFTAVVKAVLERFGLAINDGVASLQKLVVETFSAKTARVEQIEMTDRATGQLYCTWIANGEWIKVAGDCESAGKEKIEDRPTAATVPADDGLVSDVVGSIDVSSENTMQDSGEILTDPVGADTENTEETEADAGEAADAVSDLDSKTQQ